MVVTTRAGAARQQSSSTSSNKTAADLIETVCVKTKKINVKQSINLTASNTSLQRDATSFSSSLLTSNNITTESVSTMVEPITSVPVTLPLTERNKN